METKLRGMDLIHLCPFTVNLDFASKCRTEMEWQVMALNAGYLGEGFKTAKAIWRTMMEYKGCAILLCLLLYRIYKLSFENTVL